MIKKLFWWFGTNRKAILGNAAREICSTNEGQEFARKFLANEKNKRFDFYEPLYDFFNYCE